MAFFLSAYCGATLRVHRRLHLRHLCGRWKEIGPSTMCPYPISAMVEIFACLTHASAPLTGSYRLAAIQVTAVND